MTNNNNNNKETLIELTPKALTRENDIPTIEEFKSYKGTLLNSENFGDNEIKDYLFSAVMHVNDAMSNALVLIGGLDGISKVITNGDDIEFETGFLGSVTRWQVETIIMDVATKAMNFYEDFNEMSFNDIEGQNEATTKTIQGRVWENIRQQFLPTIRARINATGVYNFVFKRVLPYASKQNLVTFNELIDGNLRITTSSFVVAGKVYTFTNQKQFNEAIASVIEDIAAGAINTALTSVSDESTEMFNPIPSATQQDVNRDNVTHGKMQDAQIELNRATNVVQEAEIATNAQNIATNASNINSVTTFIVNSNKSFRSTFADLNISGGVEADLIINESDNTYPYLEFTAPNRFIWNDTVDGNDLVDQALDISANFDASGAGSNVTFIVRNSAGVNVYQKTATIQDGGALILLDKVTFINTEIYTCHVLSTNAVRMTGGKLTLIGDTLGGGGASLSSEVVDDSDDKPFDGINEAIIKAKNSMQGNEQTVYPIISEIDFGNDSSTGRTRVNNGKNNGLATTDKTFVGSINELYNMINNIMIPVGGYSISITAPLYGTWTEVPNVSDGMAILLGGDEGVQQITTGSAKRSKIFQETKDAGNIIETGSGINAVKGIQSFDGSGNLKNVGDIAGTGNLRGEFYTDGGDNNKAWGIKVGLKIWLRTA